MITRIIVIASLLAIAGCTGVRPDAEPAAPAAAEPVPRLIPTERGNFVCVAPNYEQSEEWAAACAPIGSWRQCVERTTKLRCANDPRRPA